MMYILFKKPDTGEMLSRTWHVGEEVPTRIITKMCLLGAGEVVEVQADGDELITVRAQIMGIPRASTRDVVRWFGDDARFIVANLR